MGATWGARQLFGVAVLVALSPPAQGQTPTDREILEAHNRVRAGVGVPPLQWSKRLADLAQQWANGLAASGKFTHRKGGKYGENLFEMRGARATPGDVVTAWAIEARDYNAAKNTCRGGAVCGHYTQIVWRSTKQVGCGVAQRGKRQVWVCNYDPPGNWEGQRPY